MSISDLVADLRAPTPTAAAELITPQVTDLLEGLELRTMRVARSARHALELARAQFERLLAYDGLIRPLGRLRERGQLLDEVQQRLRLATSEHFEKSANA